MLRVTVFFVVVGVCRGFLMPSLDSDPPKCECDCQDKNNMDLYKNYYGRYYNNYNGMYKNYQNQMAYNPGGILRELENEEEAEGLIETIKRYLGASTKKNPTWNQNWNLGQAQNLGQNWNGMKMYGTYDLQQRMPRRMDAYPKPNMNQMIDQSYDMNMAKKLGGNMGGQWDYSSVQNQYGYAQAYPQYKQDEISWTDFFRIILGLLAR